ncbi:hypothetical protein D3C83_48180 [compost metagenome]
MAEAPEDAAGEGGLACSQLAGEVDHQVGLEAGRQCGAEGEGVGFGGEEAGQVGHGRIMMETR